MFRKGAPVSAICPTPQVVGSRPPGEVCCFCVSQGAGRPAGHGSSLSAPSAAGGASAALTGLHHHVREMLHLGVPPDIVQDGQGLHVLGHAARRGGGFGVQGGVHAQHLGKTHRLEAGKPGLRPETLHAL